MGEIVGPKTDVEDSKSRLVLELPDDHSKRPVSASIHESTVASKFVGPQVSPTGLECLSIRSTACEMGFDIIPITPVGGRNLGETLDPV